jgi:hypothetical protein
MLLVFERAVTAGMNSCRAASQPSSWAIIITVSGSIEPSGWLAQAMK